MPILHPSPRTYFFLHLLVLDKLTQRLIVHWKWEVHILLCPADRIESAILRSRPVQHEILQHTACTFSKLTLKASSCTQSWVPKRPSNSILWTQTALDTHHLSTHDLYARRQQQKQRHTLKMLLIIEVAKEIMPILLNLLPYMHS